MNSVRTIIALVVFCWMSVLLPRLWHNVNNCNNLVVDNVFDHAEATSDTWPITGGGTYTWPIHPRWRVKDTTTDYPLNGWTDQKHTLSADGTMQVEKFGHTVIRVANEHSGTAQ